MVKQKKVTLQYLQTRTWTCPSNNYFDLSLPIGWRAEIVNNGNLPSREEHVFAFQEATDPQDSKTKFSYLKTEGKMELKEVFVTGYGNSHETATCRTWDGREPLQKCRFPFKVQVKVNKFF